MNGHNDLDSHTSRYLTEFVSESVYDPKNFRGVSKENLPVVENIVQRNIFEYDFDIQRGEYVGELARRSVERFDKTVKILRFNNQVMQKRDFFMIICISPSWFTVMGTCFVCCSLKSLRITSTMCQTWIGMSNRAGKTPQTVSRTWVCTKSPEIFTENIRLLFCTEKIILSI